MKRVVLLTILSCAMLCGCGQGAAVAGTQETPEAVETTATESADVETESADGATAEQDAEYNIQVLAGAFGADRAALWQTVSALAAEGCGRIALVNNIKDGSLVKVGTFE